MQQLRINVMVFMSALLLTLLAVFPAHADVSIGADARLAGMGGAGLAVPDIQECQENPAFMAYCRSMIGVQMPSVTAQLDGISLHQLTSNMKGGSVDSGQALNLAKDVGQQPVTFGAGLNAGIYLFDLNLSWATVQGKVRPNRRHSKIGRPADTRPVIFRG